LGSEETTAHNTNIPIPRAGGGAVRAKVGVMARITLSSTAKVPEVASRNDGRNTRTTSSDLLQLAVSTFDRALNLYLNDDFVEEIYMMVKFSVAKRFHSLITTPRN
jgi:hypothetical protein